MASIIRHKAGWRALVNRQGRRVSRVFASRAEARDWAARQEYLILQGDRIAAATTLGEVLGRYAREVSPGRRGHRWEALRLTAMGRDALAAIRLRDLSAADIAGWRDRRLAIVAPGTVRREMALLAAVLTQARREWGLIDRSPLADVRKPPAPPPRNRLPTPAEFEALAHAAGDDLAHATARVWHAFRLACETGMRAGELVGLTWDRVDLARAVVTLPRTKNGHAREVPLSSAAVALLDALPRRDPVLGLTSGQVDALWRKIRTAAGADGLHFHDSRAYACTMLARRVDVLTLARIIGHRDLRSLQVYYRETAEDIARRLG
ncbi:MAG: site-specific integrase [Rhodobacteraceae bacterium]|nr:site-specific integrase [Paracoccaceae bacterium]